MLTGEVDRHSTLSQEAGRLAKHSTPLRGLVVAHAAVYGGMMSNFGKSIAERLVEDGAELHFFASRLPVCGWDPPIVDLERIGGQFHGLPLPPHFAPLWDLCSLFLMVVELRRYRVQVLHTRGSIMGAIGRVAAKLAGVPMVIHHQDDLYFRDNTLSPQTRRLVAFVERQLSKIADRSLFISEAVLQDAISAGFKKTTCVFVGLDMNDGFLEARSEIDGAKERVLSQIRGLGVPEDGHIVGCVARLVHHKGIDLLLEAARRLAHAFPDWSFVVKGSGPLLGPLRVAIHEYGLTKRVFLVSEQLPGHDLPALYRCFDLFALPTRREGFGMVFAEAMVMGVPVIGPRIAPVTEVVPEDCGVLVEPENPDALACAMGALMSDDLARRRIGARGQAHALAAFCDGKAAGRVIDIYRDLLREKRTIRPKVPSSNIINHR